MNAEQKAKELVEKFKAITIQYVLNGEANEADVFDEAKQCALIAVEEIIKVAPLQGFDNIDSEYSFMIEEHPESFEEYWQQVKEEIQKL